VVGRVERLIPPEVAMAMLAGSALGLCVAPFTALGEHPAIVAPAIAGFFAARKANVSWFPAAAGAVALGLPAAVLFGPNPGFASPAVPAMHPLLPHFSLDSLVALVPPLTVFVLIGNAQGRAVLMSNGFEPPLRAVGAASGAMGVVHALLGGPPASMQRVAMAVLTGEDAGRADRRWVAAALAGAGCLLIAVFAVPLDAFTASLHPAFVDALIGLLLLKVLADALKRATESGSMAGPIAFCAAASSMTLGGLTPEFWALAIGCGVALFERVHLDARPLSSSPPTPQNPPHLHPHLEGATPR
jgi:benzoate membrane transport protein